MRRFALSLVPVTLICVAGFARSGSEERFDPRFANLVSACTPGSNPSVQPQRVTMSRQDSVIWRQQSGAATRWVITPKNAQDWLFDQTSFTGTQQAPAVTRRPRTGALANHPYAYRVQITCADGSSQTIDPDIIIGDAESF